MVAIILAVAGLARPARAERPAYPWLEAPPAGTIADRVPPPQGFRRLPAGRGSFAAWLRGLPVKPGRPPVRLYDGRLKTNQEAHHLVLDVDVGARDRQQCADAVMRLRAEYQRALDADGAICFHFSDGTLARWTDWRDGLRPAFGRTVTWRRTGPRDDGYASFRRYLDLVFAYAGSASLAKELEPVRDGRQVQAGDVFIQGGLPGHAVIVVDVAEDPGGRRAVLLAQSYMPAQEIHVLRNPDGADGPWYRMPGEGPLATPEWTFPPRSLRRFTPVGCPPLR